MYITHNNKKKIDNIYEAEKNACTSGGDEEGEETGGQVTMKQALFTDDRYKRSSWVAILIMAF